VTLVLRRDELEVEALIADRYVEALLAAHARQADDAPASAELDPSLRATAHRLASALPRVHPSFRFTEALAADLAAGRSAGLIVTDRAVTLSLAELRTLPSRPLLIGGAVAAALSLAGAAMIAWRLGAVGPTTLERVARATGRLSATALAQPRGRMH
jgi:hypothetical protein